MVSGSCLMKRQSIYIISDSTGATAEQMVRSALVQFEVESRVVRYPRVHTHEKVKSIIGEAARERALLFHTLVQEDLRKYLLEQARAHNLDAMDLMGPILDRLTVRFRVPPRKEPGLFKHVTEKRRREIEAVEFAFHHDDGTNLDSIDQSEMVLVGLSRMMKTPTMLFLAYRGWFCANVPLVMEFPIPEKLAAYPANNVFCLDLAEHRLVELRRTRGKTDNLPPKYMSLDYIRKERSYASGVCRKHHWRIVNTTGKSVEEVAGEILALRGERQSSG